MEPPKNQNQPGEGRKVPETSPEGGETGPLMILDHRTETVNNPDVSPECRSASNTTDTTSPEFSEFSASPDSWTQASSFFKKSRTHDCVLHTAVSPGFRDGGWTPTVYHHHRLVSSSSFSGFGSTHLVLRENQSSTASNREIIDYRNLTPQLPFVPSVAKTVPKKRIFLRKPKKAIKDFFVHKKHSSENATSPRTPSEQGPTPKRTRKPSKRRDRRKSSPDMNDTLSDSSSECCATVCEDAASLKSFGSQAGCGEIFADEEYLVSLEGTTEIPKQSPVSVPSQGGKEQLASPAQAQVLDLFETSESFKSNNLLSPTSSMPASTSSPGENLSITSRTTEAKITDLFGTSERFNLLTQNPSPTTSTPASTSNPGENLSVLSKTSEAKITELNPITETPKSENQESTSDEGYCDYVSNEDQTRSSLTPVHSGKFPRDTYSGDALFDLFYEPSEAEMTPIFDDEMDLTQSIIGQSSELPLSMYSFHVGAEENLAPPLAVDFISHELLQSNWAGRDCLLKLCDTEISLAMGIVNWLKQRTLKSVPAESPESCNVDNGHEDKTPSTEIRNEPRGSVLRTVQSQDSKSRDICQLDVGHPPAQPRMVSTVTTPDSQPRTPTNHVCFRIFNINSPLTPTKDLPSPMALSPSSGTSSLFVLAINKESLCESCKASLRLGAKELHLCHSCTSSIERIKTSELWARASLQPPAGTPQPVKGELLPSPTSSCGVASDISLLSLVEQCASQVSALRINKYPHLPGFETRGIVEAGKDTQPKKDPAKKFLKSKQKKKKFTTKGGHTVDHPNVKNQNVHSPSLLEAEGLGLVTTNDSNDFVLETYKSPCYSKNNILNHVDISQTSRPTSLLLTSPTCSESSRKHHKVKEKLHERSRRHKKPMMNTEGSSESVFPEEKKVERKRRMKK